MTSRAGPRGPTNSMHVSLGFIWQFEVYHVSDVIYIYAAACDVGGNKHLDLA